jgi:hypothetical protein
MCFDAPSHVRDGVLRCDTENLGKRKRHCAIDQSSRASGKSKQWKQILAVLSDYFVNQDL